MSLLRSAATISLLTLLSRITGLVREMLIARYFGAGAATDAFYVAFRIPNMLRRLFAEGAFSQAFVPMLSHVKEKCPADEQKAFTDRVFTLLALAVFGVTVLGVFAAPVLVWLLASGLADNPTAFDLASQMTRVMFPYIIFMSLMAFSAAILNTWKHFAVPAFTPVLLNVSFIACTLLLADRFAEPVWALATAVVIGGVAQLSMQLFALWRMGVRLSFVRPSTAWRDKSVRQMLALMLPAVVGVSVAPISLLINTNIASHIAQGAITWLNFADRLMEFPTALLGVALGTVLLPGLSSAYARGETERYNALLDRSLKIVVLIGVPCSVGLGLLATGLTAVLYQGRIFTAHDVVQTAAAMQGYAIGLLGIIAIKILAPAFYARKDLKTPLYIAVAAVCVVQTCNLFFVPLFAQAGLALSISMGALFNALALTVVLVRRAWFVPQGGWFVYSLRVLAGSAAMGAMLFACQTDIVWTQMQNAWAWRATLIALIVLGAIVTYFATLFVLGWRAREVRAAARLG